MTHDIELRGRAYHEAGHAVVYRFFGIDVVRVSIEPDGKGHDGECMAVNPHPIEVSRQGGICPGSPFIAHRIMGILAGRVAQEMFAADSVKPHHDRYDCVNVRAWVGKYDPLARPQEHEEEIEQLTRDTREMLRNPLITASVKAVASALLVAKRLTAEEVWRVIGHAEQDTTRSGIDMPECPHCRRDSEC